MIELLIVLIFLTIIGVCCISYFAYDKYKLLTKDIDDAIHGVNELEGYTYHSESEINDWIDDKTRDIQYDIDEHSTTIDNLNSDKADEYELEKMKKVHAEDAENIGILINSNAKRLQNVIEYLSKAYSSFKDVKGIELDDEEYNNFLKSFDDTSIWTDKRRSEHHKVLATLLDEGNYNASHEDMGDEIYYKVYNLLIGKGDKNESR